MIPAALPENGLATDPRDLDEGGVFGRRDHSLEAVVPQLETDGYGFQDEYTTDCCEDTLSLNAGAVCISGTTAASELGNYDIWGGGMAFNFNDNDPWDGSAYSGIEFNAAVESDVIVLVKLIMPGMPQDEEHFVELVPDMNTVLWTDVAQPDWATPIRFDPSELVSIEFVVPPGDGAPNPFSLCISKMRILE